RHEVRLRRRGHRNASGVNVGDERFRGVDAIEVVDGAPRRPPAAVVLLVGGGHQKVSGDGGDGIAPSWGADVAGGDELASESLRVCAPVERATGGGHATPFLTDWSPPCPPARTTKRGFTRSWQQTAPGALRRSEGCRSFATQRFRCRTRPPSHQQ